MSGSFPRTPSSGASKRFSCSPKPAGTMADSIRFRWGFACWRASFRTARGAASYELRLFEVTPTLDLLARPEPGCVGTNEDVVGQPRSLRETVPAHREEFVAGVSKRGSNIYFRSETVNLNQPRCGSFPKQHPSPF